MTKEELQIKEKLYPINLGLFRNKHKAKDIFQKLKENHTKYLNDSHNLVLKPLNKILKSSDCSIFFDETQNRVNIYQESELISTIEYSNFISNFSQIPSQSPIIKIQNFFSINKNSLDKKEVYKLKILEKVNSYLLKNESKIIQKVPILFKKHQKIHTNLHKKLKPFKVLHDKLYLKKMNLFYPYFYKDVKNGITFTSELHPTISFPKGTFKFSKIKLDSNNTFLCTISKRYDIERGGRIIHMKIDNPEEFIKFHLLPQLEDVLYFSIDDEVNTYIDDNHLHEINSN